MDDHVNDFRNTGDNTAADILGNIVAVAYAQRAFHDDVQIRQDTGADETRADAVGLLYATGLNRNLGDMLLNFPGGSGIDQFADCGPDDFQRGMQYKHRDHGSPDQIQK